MGAPAAPMHGKARAGREAARRQVRGETAVTRVRPSSASTNTSGKSRHGSGGGTATADWHTGAPAPAEVGVRLGAALDAWDAAAPAFRPEEADDATMEGLKALGYAD